MFLVCWRSPEDVAEDEKCRKQKTVKDVPAKVLIFFSFFATWHIAYMVNYIGAYFLSSAVVIMYHISWIIVRKTQPVPHYVWKN